MFSVTPVGFALVLTGILYFVLFGRWVLPGKSKKDEATSAQSVKDYVKRLYGLKADIFEVVIPEGHLLVGQTLADMMEAYHLYIIGTYHHGQKWLAPPVETTIVAPCRLAILGHRKVIQEIADVYDLRIEDRLKVFNEEFSPAQSGIAEIVIPPNSQVIGKTARDLVFRKTFGLNLLAIHRVEETLSYVETEDHPATVIGKVPFQAGDTLVVQTQWTRLTRLKNNSDFVIVTSEFPQDDVRPKKVGWALFFFLVAISLVLFTDVRLSLCLLTGAAGMIVTGVLSVDEAYHAVGWNTVFLLAGLIPLGQAVQSTGTAEWIAQQILNLLEGWPIWSLQAGIAALATVFTLIMSNVGATVLLVPLAVSIALASGGDPAIFAMTVAISTSNSFLIPTHQVNALIMGPAGYRVADFMRTGGIMTILFLVVSLLMMNLVF